MATIYEEAAQTIVDADRAAAEEVAQRALDRGPRPRRHHAERLRAWASRRSASSSRAARSSSPS